MHIIALVTSGLFWVGFIALLNGDYSVAFSCGIPAILLGGLFARA
jgi:hypothetical protein